MGNKLRHFISYLFDKLTYIAHARPHLRQIIDNVSWLTFNRLARLGVGLFVGVWLARYLGPSQFGMYSYTLAIVAVFASIGTLGLHEITIRDFVATPNKSHEILGTAAVLQAVGGVLSYALLLLLIQILHADEPAIKLIVTIFGASLLFKAAGVIRYWFEAKVLSKYVVWTETTAIVLIAGGKILLIILNAPLLAFIIISASEAALIAVALIVAFQWRGSTSAPLAASLPRAKSMLRDSWPLILSALAVMVYMRIDQIMLRKMIDDEAVGLYSAAVRLSEVWYFIPAVIVASVFPSIIRAKHRSKVEYYAKLQKLFTLMALLAIGISIPTLFAAKWVIVLVFGDAYSSAHPILAIHIWASVFVFLSVANSKWFLLEGLQKLILAWTLIGASVNIGLNLLFIPNFGGLGAAWATLIAQAVAGVALNATNRKTRHIFFMQLKAFYPLSLR